MSKKEKGVGQTVFPFQGSRTDRSSHAVTLCHLGVEGHIRIFTFLGRVHRPQTTFEYFNGPTTSRIRH